MSYKARFPAIAGNSGHYSCSYNCSLAASQPNIGIHPMQVRANEENATTYGIHSIMRPSQAVSSLSIHADTRVPLSTGVGQSTLPMGAGVQTSVPDLTRMHQSSMLPPESRSGFGFASSTMLVNGVHHEVPPQNLNRVLSTNGIGGTGGSLVSRPDGGYGSRVVYGATHRHTIQVAATARPGQSYPMIALGNATNGGLGVYQTSHGSGPLLATGLGPPLPQSQSYQSTVANLNPTSHTNSEAANAQSLPVLILWDVENVQMPRDVPVAHAVHAVRSYVQKALKGNSQWFETDFAVACDVFRHPPKRIVEMNDAQITVIHVNSMSKNAADMKLKSYMHKFATMFSRQSACIVLISGDVNFAPELHLARHHAKLQVVLLHNHLTPSTLREIAHCADDFYRVVMSTPYVEGPESVWAAGAGQVQQHRTPLAKQSTHIMVANLPEDVETDKISKRLLKVSENTGGRIVNVRGSLALMKFPSAQNATRALARITERDVCGHRVRAYFVDDPGFRGNHRFTPNRSNAEVSKSSGLPAVGRESRSGGEPTHSNTSSDSAGTPATTNRGYETSGDCRSVRRSPRGGACLRQGQMNAAAFESSCTGEPRHGQVDSSPCGTSSSDTRDDDNSSSSHCSSQLGPDLIEDTHRGMNNRYTYLHSATLEDVRDRSFPLDFLLPDSIDEDESSPYSATMSFSCIGIHSEDILSGDVPCTASTCEENDLSNRTTVETNSDSSGIAQLLKAKQHSSCIMQDHHLDLVDCSGRGQISHRCRLHNCPAQTVFNEAIEHDVTGFKRDCGGRQISATSGIGLVDLGDGCVACTGITLSGRGAASSEKGKSDKLRRSVSSSGKRAAKRASFDARPRTPLEESLMMLAYIVHKVLNDKQLLFSLLPGNADDEYTRPDEHEATILLPLDRISWEDLKPLRDGRMLQNARVVTLLDRIGACVVSTLMGYPSQVEDGCVEPYSRAKCPASVATAKPLLRMTASSGCQPIKLPDFIKDLPAAKRISCFQEIVQELAEMLQLTRCVDTYDSAKVIIALGTESRRELTQRWISQFLYNDRSRDNTLDPFRALQRCRKLPMTMEDVGEEIVPESRPHFRLQQARALGGPDAVTVLALFMTSLEPLCLTELEARFFKMSGYTLPLSAIHILHGLGAIQVVPSIEAEDCATTGTSSTRFDIVHDLCRVVRSLIRHMNRNPNAIYHLQLSSTVGADSVSVGPVYTYTDACSISALLRKSNAGRMPDVNVAKMLDDFVDFFEKLPPSAGIGTTAFGHSHNSYRLRECVVHPRQVDHAGSTASKGSQSAEQKSSPSCTTRSKDSPSSQEASPFSSGSSEEQQRPTTVATASSTRGRRSLRLAAIFP